MNDAELLFWCIVIIIIWFFIIQIIWPDVWWNNKNHTNNQNGWNQNYKDNSKLHDKLELLNIKLYEEETNKEEKENEIDKLLFDSSISIEDDKNNKIKIKKLDIEIMKANKKIQKIKNEIDNINKEIQWVSTF